MIQSSSSPQGRKTSDAVASQVLVDRVILLKASRHGGHTEENLPLHMREGAMLI